MIIEETHDTPYVHLSASECKFEIKGNSYFIEVNDLYDKIHKWIDKEIPEINCRMHWVLHFEVISSASFKNIVDIITKLDLFYKKGKKIRVTWVCDKGDEANIEMANDYLDFTEMPFTVVERY